MRDGPGVRPVDVVLSVDISSSGVRARAHDDRLRTQGESAVDLHTSVDATGRSTHDFEEICAGVRQVVADVLSGPGLRVRALAASGTASSLASARRDADGRISAISPVLLWSDTRARVDWAPLAEEVVNAFPRTLCPPDVSYWPAKLRWARRSRDEAATVIASDLVFGGAKDLVFSRLTGQLWTDPMSAASTGVFDSAGWQWDDALLAHVGVSPSQLPEVHPANASAPLLPEPAARLGLPAGLPVLTGGMDGPLTQIGAAGFDPGIASCTVGTSLAFRVNSPERRIDPTARIWCYPIDRENWVIGGAANNGGNVLTWIRDRLSPTADIGALVSAAIDLDADPTLLFVPYLLGERAPLWRPELRAAFVGLAPHHTVPDMARAAIGGIAGALVELATAVRSLSGELNSVRLTGGFTRDARWVQVMTDALGIRTALPDPESATATGAAMLAWSHVRGVPVTSVFEPGQKDLREPTGTAHAGHIRTSDRIRSVRDSLWPAAPGT